MKKALLFKIKENPKTILVMISWIFLPTFSTSERQQTVLSPELFENNSQGDLGTGMAYILGVGSDMHLGESSIVVATSLNKNILKFCDH